MDKETLKQYRPLQMEIKRLDRKIDRLYERQEELPVVKGRVKKSSDDFPYIEEHMSVQMSEPVEADEIKKLLRIREKRRRQAQKTVLDIEQFIAGIPDSTDRQIFELTFLEGKKQKEVADKMGLERSSISKKIDRCLQLSHNSQK